MNAWDPRQYLLYERDQLCRLSGHIEMWSTTYFHVLENHGSIIEWYSSTGLKPYLARLQTEGERRRFGQQILEKCASEYPARGDGKIVFPFKRLFFTALKKMS